jgi:hypothetical protein
MKTPILFILKGFIFLLLSTIWVVYHVVYFIWNFQINREMTIKQIKNKIDDYFYAFTDDLPVDGSSQHS